MGGRGRGRGSMPYRRFSGETLPPLNQPPPVYPPLQFKPIPLLTGKKILYTLTLKQEIRSSFKESGYYVPPVCMKKDIERYTDKYQQIHAADQVSWNKRLFPKELFEQPQKKKKKVAVKKEVAVVEKLEVLEAKEQAADVEEEEEKEEEGEEGLEENEEEVEELYNVANRCPPKQ